MFAGLQTDGYWVDEWADPEDPSQSFSGEQTTARKF